MPSDKVMQKGKGMRPSRSSHSARNLRLKRNVRKIVSAPRRADPCEPGYSNSIHFIETFPKWIALNIPKTQDAMSRDFLIANVRIEKRAFDLRRMSWTRRWQRGSLIGVTGVV